MKNSNLSKEEVFKERADGIRKQFAEMPLGLLLVVQGLLVEAVEQSINAKQEGE